MTADRAGHGALQDKTVLITGANRGLGRSLAEEALERGAGVVFAGTRQPLSHPDPRLRPVDLDVTAPDQIRAAAERIGALDVLINNAGIMLPDRPSDAAVLDQHLAVNLWGAEAVTRAFLPSLINTRGRVINLLSVVALAPLPMFTAYAMSKAAAFSQTKALRATHSRDGVRFHAVLAGPIDTDMTRALDIPKTAPADVARAILDAVDRDEDDIFPDPATAALTDPWSTGPDKIIERQFGPLFAAVP